jgi:phage major head subunit gpT-like protein
MVLATYGEHFGVTRQAIINDDMSFFSRVPAKMGRAARTTIGDIAYGVLTSSANLADGQPLFHSTHDNLITTGTAISSQSVATMRVLMARQRSLKTAQNPTGLPLNVRLSTLVVSPEQYDAALQVRNSEWEVGGTKTLTVPNTVRNAFEVVTDPRLTGGAWYGVASPAVYDGIEVAYLGGVETPYLESMQGWEIDGTEWKVRIDVGAGVLDYRAFVKNPGV